MFKIGKLLGLTVNIVIGNVNCHKKPSLEISTGFISVQIILFHLKTSENF
jgi:hypothetical protein